MVGSSTKINDQAKDDQADNKRDCGVHALVAVMDSNIKKIANAWRSQDRIQLHTE